MNQWRNRKFAFVLALMMFGIIAWGVISILEGHARLVALGDYYDLFPPLAFFLLWSLVPLYLLWRVFFKKDWIS